jgi:hypothetical protein
VCQHEARIGFLLFGSETMKSCTSLIPLSAELFMKTKISCMLSVHSIFEALCYEIARLFSNFR